MALREGRSTMDEEIRVVIEAHIPHKGDFSKTSRECKI